jgi:RNA polymerase sigma-70 factor (ECF subfamily)
MSDRAAPPPIDVLLAHREWVRRFARSLARDDASADDLVQDAWIAAVEHPPRHTDAPAGWLRRVLVRRAIHVSVERRRRDVRERAAARPEARPAAGDVVAVAEAHRRVVEAVMALDEPYRTTILLRLFEDLPPREVAARMDVPVETVRSRVRRACEQLRARLDEEHGGDRAAWLVPLIGGPVAAGRGGPARARPRTLRPALGIAAAVVLPAAAVVAIFAHGDADDGTRTVAAAARGVGGSERRRESARTARRATPTGAVAEEASAPTPPEQPPSAAPVDERAPHEFVVSVVDPDRAPVAGVRIRIDPAEMKDELDATSDERGRAKFTVTGAIRTATALPRAADGRAWRSVAQRVAVPAGARAVELVVERGAWISGRALNADGTPYPFAGVVALDHGRTVGSAFADDNGVYEIAVPPEGRWDIALTGESHEVFGTENSPTGRITQVMDRGRGPTDGEIRDIGAGAQGVELVAREPVGTGELMILVRTPDGRPLAGVPLRIDRNTWKNEDGTPVTDADGRVTVHDVPNCRVGVSVGMGPLDPRPWADSGFMPPVDRLRLRPGADENVIEFRPARPVRGRVVVPPDLTWRDPAHPPPAVVRLQEHGVSVSIGWMEADGRFTVFAPASSPGPFEASIDVRSADGRTYRAAAEAAPGAQEVLLPLVTADPPPAPQPRAAAPVVEPK